MPAKTPPKGKKAAAPKAPKKTAAKAKKSPVVDEDEDTAEAAEDLAAEDAEEGDEEFDLGAEAGDEEDDDDEDDEDDEDEDEDGEKPAKKAAKSATPAKPAAKKPAAPAPALKAKTTSDDAPAVVPARRLTPEAKARVNEMVKKGMSLTDALKQAASWETFVAPVKDEPAKLVQGRMGNSNSGGGGDGPRHSNFAGETEPEDVPEAGGDEDEPASADED